MFVGFRTDEKQTLEDVLMMIKNKKVGLALGGGAALGAAHIGVLRAIEERNITVDYISGTSIGALIASLYAFEVSVDDIEQIAINLKWLDITNISFSKYGVLSNSKMEKLISQYIKYNNIEESTIPLAMIATDISNGDKVVLNKGNVAQSIMASSCIPGIFIPVEIDDKMLVDGAITENVPVQTIKEMGAEFIIGIDLNPMHSSGKPNNIIDVLLNSFHYSIKHIVENQIDDADFIIKPNLSKYSLSSTKNIQSIIHEGYIETIRVLDLLQL